MRHSIVPIVLVCSLPLSAGATIHVVHPDGTGDFPTIQAAMDAALDGDEIVLTDGLFTGDGNRDVDFVGKAVTVRSESGDPASCVINCGGPVTESHIGFYFRTGEGPGSVLDGVTILNGRATHFPVIHGAAVHCEGASPSVRNCALIAGRAEISGALYLSGSAALISDCVISVCWSQSRSAVHVADGSSVVLERCVISGNATDWYGGGLGVYDSQATLTDCLITGNYAAASPGPCVPGGGGIYAQSAAVIVRGGTISGNGTGAECAGGIAAGSGAIVALERTILRHNCGTGGGAGSLADAVVGYTSILTIECSAVDPDGIGGEGTVTYLEPTILDDPRFCGAWSCDDAPTSGGDYSLWNDSPCLPSGNPCGALIGALGQGCELIGAPDTSARPLVARFHAEPNPARDGTVRVSLEALAPLSCRLEAFDVAGRWVGSVFEGHLEAGRHVIPWRANAPPGVYVLRLDAGGSRTTTSVVRLE